MCPAGTGGQRITQDRSLQAGGLFICVSIAMNKSTEQPVKNDAADQQNRQQLRTKAFRIALEMIAVFGVPAAIALFFGQWLQDQGGQPEWVTYVLLGAAFVISWVIVFYRVRSIASQFKDNQRKREAADGDNKDDVATASTHKNNSS